MPLRLNRLPPFSQTIRETYFIFSHEFRSFNATSAKHHLNNNWRSIWAKMFAIRSWADEGALISFSRYSSSNFSYVRPSWFLKSNWFTSAFCSFAHFQRFLDTPRSSFCRQFSSSFIVSRAIHQERVVFLVSLFLRGSFVICCPTLWCWPKCCMKQHTASLSGTQASFCPRTSFSHWISDLSKRLQQSTTWTITDAQSGWKCSPSEVGQMRVASPCFGVLQQQFLPHFVSELHFVTWVHIFQCNSSQAPREAKPTLSPGERVCHQELGRWGWPHLVLELLQQQSLRRLP